MSRTKRPRGHGSEGTPRELETAVRERILDAAEALWYGHGIQAVGMDAIRDAAGVSLKRIYALYPSKEDLVVAVLERRDIRWRGRLAAYVERESDPEARILAVYDWLRDWFQEPGFRGCAWINAYGELGAVSPAVARVAKRHKAAFKGYLLSLVRDAKQPDELADALLLLAEGAMATAGIFAAASPAGIARRAAASLMAGTVSPASHFDAQDSPTSV